MGPVVRVEVGTWDQTGDVGSKGIVARGQGFACSLLAFSSPLNEKHQCDHRQPTGKHIPVSTPSPFLLFSLLLLPPTSLSCSLLFSYSLLPHTLFSLLFLSPLLSSFLLSPPSIQSIFSSFPSTPSCFLHSLSHSLHSSPPPLLSPFFLPSLPPFPLPSVPELEIISRASHTFPKQLYHQATS